MSYGHMTMFFANAAEAREYLASCRASKNYSAENYQDRVAAQHCILIEEGWAPAPIRDFPRKPQTSHAPANRRRAS